jgi:hypothetical protein
MRAALKLTDEQVVEVKRRLADPNPNLSHLKKCESALRVGVYESYHSRGGVRRPQPDTRMDCERSTALSRCDAVIDRILESAKRLGRFPHMVMSGRPPNRDASSKGIALLFDT